MPGSIQRPMPAIGRSRPGRCPSVVTFPFGTAITVAGRCAVCHEFLRHWTMPTASPASLSTASIWDKPSGCPKVSPQRDGSQECQDTKDDNYTAGLGTRASRSRMAVPGQFIAGLADRLFRSALACFGDPGRDAVT